MPSLLLAFPEAGYRAEHGVRCFVVLRLPYLIYYRVNAAKGTVSIVTILHAAMDRDV